jgi:hypothetical protein
MCIEVASTMPFIAVPGVAQFNVKGVIESHVFQNIWYYSQPTSQTLWSTAQLNTVCDAIMAGLALASGVASLTNPAVSWTNVTAVDLSTSTPATGANSHATVSGTATAGAVPPSVCVVVSNVTGDRYRGGHPRTYMPPMSSSFLDANNDAWNTTQVGQYQTAYQNVHDNVFSSVSGIFQCIPRYNYTYTDNTTKRKWEHQKASLNHVAHVVTWRVRPAIGYQTRRSSVGG